MLLLVHNVLVLPVPHARVLRNYVVDDGDHDVDHEDEEAEHLEELVFPMFLVGEVQSDIIEINEAIEPNELTCVALPTIVIMAL